MSDGPDPETLLNLTSDTVVVLSEEGRYRSVNATATDVLGFDSAELVGVNAFSLVHPDDETRVRDWFDRAVAGEAAAPDPIEYRYATADGDWVWLRTRIHPPAETGADGYVLLSRDVTREVESRQRLETIASASSDVFWLFSADWSELLFVNGALEDVFGVSPDRLEREPRIFLESVHPDDRPYVERAMDRLSSGESVVLDYRIGKPDETTRWIRVPGEPVVEDGNVVAVTGFARDITDEYRRERQLVVMDNLLRHTIRNNMNIVDGTAEQIADCVTAAAAPAASMSDGGTTPGDVSSNGDAHCGAPPDDAEFPLTEADMADLCADVVDHAETIRRVAADLLTTAEKQRGVIDLLRQRGSPRSVAIAPVVEAALDMVVDDCGGRDAIDVSYGIPDGDLSAEAETDAEAAPSVAVRYPRDSRAFTYAELDYAIAELVENAIEHAESRPRVRIEVTETAERVEIAIRDNCPPIPVEERCVISDRWEMDDLRHTGGMGLWLVYWVTDRSGGDLSFDTHSNGNVVTLSVPQADSAEHVDVATFPRGRPGTGARR